MYTLLKLYHSKLVRHRIASFAQESTRYCNYAKDKFGREITVIKPVFFKEGSASYIDWVVAIKDAEKYYFKLLDNGSSPQEARSVLPNSLKTEISVTANYREWRNFFKLRADKAAHPQMREVVFPLLNELKQRIPVVFDDITGYEYDNTITNIPLSSDNTNTDTTTDSNNEKKYRVR